MLGMDEFYMDYGFIDNFMMGYILQEEHSSQFGKYEEGNEMFFDEFNR